MERKIFPLQEIKLQKSSLHPTAILTEVSWFLIQKSKKMRALLSQSVIL
jgi:hypothetical protein